MKRAIISLCATLLFANGCSNGIEPDVSDVPADVKTDAAMQRTSKVQSPVQIDYRVIGTPIVGQAVAIELH